MMLALDLIDDSLPNVRRVPPTKERQAAFEASVRSLGVLAPIIVRPGDAGRYQVVFGSRRFNAAKLAGHTEIPADVRAMTDDGVLEAKGVENIQRDPMHAVDQWRFVKDMLAGGALVEDACLAIGLDERTIARMRMLADLHPKMQDLMVVSMPEAPQIRQIARAPKAVQAAVVKRMGRSASWYSIANACRVTSISQKHAIFDITLAKVKFQEDLFAEPGADDQFTTTDVEGFMAAQTAALNEEIERQARGGHRVFLADFGSYELTLPRGWSRRWEKTTLSQLKAEGGPAKYMGIRPSGEIAEMFGNPPAKIIRAGGDAAEDGDTPSNVIAKPEKASITKSGQALLAAMKTEALRTRLRESGADTTSLGTLALCLLVALTGGTVTVSHASYGSHIEWSDMVATIVDPTGRIGADETTVRKLLAEALARILKVTDPTTAHGSGDAAEWIGNALGADVALPRFDTVAFLATLSGDELKAIAKTVDIAVPKTIKALREALVDNAPDWRPTTFGATGPKPGKAPRGHREMEDAA